MKRIMMPVEDATGLEAKVAHHFGRAPYFALVEFDENNKTLKVNTEPNRSEHMGGAPGHSHESFLALEAEHCNSLFNGTRSTKHLQDAGITVLEATATQSKDNIESFKEGKLKDLPADVNTHITTSTENLN